MSLKQKKIKFEPRIKLNHNRYSLVSFVLHHLVIAPIQNTNSRGQKSWDLSSNISKTSDPHPTLNKVEF